VAGPSDLMRIADEAVKDIAASADDAALEAARVRYLSRKDGVVTSATKAIATLPNAEKPAYGQAVNEAKRRIEAALESRGAELRGGAIDKSLKESADLTLPPRRVRLGRLHPISRTIREITRVLATMGFEAVEGPEVEFDYYNFEALNIPKDHPARDMQDTFYVGGEILLRTQTSPVQIRTMERRKPPVRIICPGRVYRRDADITHSPVFHQVEGLAVDRGISMADLKGTLDLFARELFGPDSRIRFRPSFFPFTEPSAEVDVLCVLCKGGGCRVCKGSGWLEILGSGMVHPRILRNMGYDTEEVTGWAFGMGIERVAMLRYGIDDIRLFFENDLRFLSQF